jgi:hexosaminidase
VPLPASSYSTPYQLCLTVVITNPSLSSWTDVSEKYSLTIPATGDITVRADSTVGAMRALATIPHLIASNAVNANSKSATSPLVWAIRPMSLLNDQPVFPYRGAMIDTARHFFPINDLKRTIDGMEVAKLNRLHLHLYDSQSFPLQWPGMDGQGTLWKLGAFKDAQGNPMAYSQDQLVDLVDYAARRGIVVIPEFDMPAHTDVFNLVHPEIMSCNPDMAKPSGQLQILVDATYTVVSNLLAWGMDSAFAGSPAFHVGQDEVHKWCFNWESVVPPESYSFIAAMKRFQGFLTSEVVTKRAKTMLAWEDLVTPISLLGSDINPENGVADDGAVVPTKASKKLLVEAWRSMDTFQWLLFKGYQTLFAVSNYWYFTCGQFCNPGTGSISFTWSYFAPIPATRSAPANFHGGEAAFWTEETHADVLDKVVWPRLGSVAERLWTNPVQSLGKTLCTQARVELLNKQLEAVGIAPWPASTVMN